MHLHASSQAQDRLATVSSNDTTPAPLLSKLSSDGSITLTEQNDGGNETLQLSTTAVTPTRKIEPWLRVTQNTAKTYIDGANDWRGMAFRHSGSAIPGTVANANLSHWDHGSVVMTCETPFGVNYAGPDVQLDSISTDAFTTVIRLFIEGGSGKLYVVVTGFSGEFQARFVVEGFAVKNGPDQTI